MKMINKYKLDQLGSVNRGKSKHRPRNDPDLYGGKYPFIQTGDVKHSPFYVTSHSQTYNEKGLAQSKLWEKGTLCITIAANIADTAILSYPACFPDSIIGFVADTEKSDTKYVKYCLDTFKLQMQSISQGTTQDNMSAGKLLSIDFPAPDLQGQKKIAAILSAYDDLIENNKRRISLLEKMAEEIYREWFVRFRFPGYQNAEFEKGIPKQWEIKNIGDIYKTSSGGTPSRKNSSNYDGEFNWIKTGELKDMFTSSSEEKITNQGIEGSSAKLFPVNTVVIAMYCAMPYISILSEESATNQACCAFLPKKEHLSHVYTYYLIKFVQNHIIQFAHGAAQQNLSQGLIKGFTLLVADKESIVKFTETVKPFFDQIQKCMEMINNSEATRNQLLPRLISDKTSVENIDIQFPPSMQAENKTLLKGH